MIPHMCMPKPEFAYKRYYDLSILFLTSPLWLPMTVIAGVLILLFSGWPVFYIQKRLGLDGKIFTIIKFRTMIRDAEKDTGPIWSTPKDKRVTRIGYVFRKFHLDELPQIINVIKGNMSLVGPRPERPELMKTIMKEAPDYGKRLAVPPGLTCISHVYGNSYTSPRWRLRYDMAYIRNIGPATDTKILMMTVWVVFRRLVRTIRI